MGKNNTFFAEGKSDPANEGKTTVADVRAVATGMEAISDGADAVAVGAAATGVGVEIAAGAKIVGTVSGAMSDAINIGADLYEGKYDDAQIRIVGSVIGYLLPKQLKTKSERMNVITETAVDKSLDNIVEYTIK